MRAAGQPKPYHNLNIYTLIFFKCFIRFVIVLLRREGVKQLCDPEVRITRFL